MLLIANSTNTNVSNGSSYEEIDIEFGPIVSGTSRYDCSSIDGWTISGQAGYVTVPVSHITHDTCMWVHAEAVSTMTYVYTNPSIETSGVWEFDILVNNSAYIQNMFALSSTSTWAVDCTFDSTANTWEYFDGSWKVITTVNNNQWYRVRITFECGAGGFDGLAADTFNAYLDGELVGSDLAFRSAVASVNRINYGTGNAAVSAQCSMVIDNINYGDVWAENLDSLEYTEWDFDSYIVSEDNDYAVNATLDSEHSGLTESDWERVIINDSLIDSLDNINSQLDSTYRNSSWRNFNRPGSYFAGSVLANQSGAVDPYLSVSTIVCNNQTLLNNTYTLHAVSYWKYFYNGSIDSWMYLYQGASSIISYVSDTGLSLIGSGGSSSSVTIPGARGKTKLVSAEDNFSFVYALGGLVFEFLAKYGLYLGGGLIGLFGGHKFIRAKLTDGIIKAKKEITRSRLYKRTSPLNVAVIDGVEKAKSAIRGVFHRE